MLQDTINFKVTIESFDRDAAKAIKLAREQLRRMEADLVSRFYKSDRYRAASDLSGSYDSGGKRSVIPRVIGDYIEAEILVDGSSKNSSKALTYFNIPEKTANLLLSGKLLTDDQKKALIKRMGFDLDALNDPAS